ncbi:hypothetical protein NLG97_g8727 [Lecanicillium saksenae]|uniref:Uncharacterized protein n=1 Tax=Lecanicillium saksenae TaxID=468837 RepID=A0ACC1QLE2_9HYPO|nr:hypothetical protein NLG97_g8727 [Lecanicillium saksenae]
MSMYRIAHLQVAATEALRPAKQAVGNVTGVAVGSNAVLEVSAGGNGARVVHAGSLVESSSAAQDFDRTGATPPPIALNHPRHARRSSVAAVSYDGASVADTQSLKLQPQAEAMSQHSIPRSQSAAGGSQLVPGSATGARRKWLPGFSRNKS